MLTKVMDERTSENVLKTLVFRSIHRDFTHKTYLIPNLKIAVRK